MTDGLLAPAHPAERLTFEAFLEQYEGVHADFLPDGTVELHMATGIPHERVISFLHMLIKFYLRFNPIGRVFLTSIAMRLSEGLPAREPDMIFLLTSSLSRLHRNYIDGPAAIVIEVISPESVERDYVTKFTEYAAGGVLEYWLIDPDRQLVGFYELGENATYQRIPLDAQGRLQSRQLPGFAIAPDLIWQEEPDILLLLDLARQMTSAAPQ